MKKYLIMLAISTKLYAVGGMSDSILISGAYTQNMSITQETGDVLGWGAGIIMSGEWMKEKPILPRTTIGGRVDLGFMIYPEKIRGFKQFPILFGGSIKHVIVGEHSINYSILGGFGIVRVDEVYHSIRTDLYFDFKNCIYYLHPIDKSDVLFSGGFQYEGLFGNPNFHNLGMYLGFSNNVDF